MTDIKNICNTTLKDISKIYLRPKMIKLFFWAIASGIPILLITSTLSARLLQSGMPIIEIGTFAICLLPYSIKFLGAPFIERYGIPILSFYFGSTRAWLLLAMTGSMLCLIWLSSISYYSGLHLAQFLIPAFCTGIFSAISDVAEAKLRIELLDAHELALGSACYSLGFGLGELIGSGGTLLIAGLYNWQIAYFCSAIIISLGLISVLLIKDSSCSSPFHLIQMGNRSSKKEPIFVSALKQMISIKKNFHDPIKQLFLSPGGFWLLNIIFFYYASSYLMSMMMNPFYLQLGFSSIEIGALRGCIGFFLISVGILFSGLICQRYGTLRILNLCSVAYFFNIIFQIGLAKLCHDNMIDHKSLLHLFLGLNIFLTYIIDGFSIVAYLTLIASLCRQPYTATQNAFLTSLMGASRIIFSSISGYLVTDLGWVNFFFLCATLTIPMPFFILKIHKINPLAQPKETLYAQ